MITISIGILAYNEEQGIARTIASTLSQQLGAVSDDQGEHAVRAQLVIVPNGCKDSTAQRAQEAIDQLKPAGVNQVGFFDARVHELSEAGKENAWNHFVDEFSAPEADMLVFMDADVELAHDRVLYNLVNTLANHTECAVAGGTPVKQIHHKKHKSVADRLSIGATSLRRGRKGMFAGCLYCGRAEVIRSMYLPTVLMGEDAFVRAMIVTEGFTKKDNPDLVIRDHEAQVLFEPYMKPAEVLRNKVRRSLELAINAIIYDKLWAESTPSKPAGALMRELQAQDPQWSQKLVKETFSARGFWAVPKHFIYKQFLQLKHHPLKRRLKLLPVAIATLPLNALAVINANRRVAKGEIRSLWNKAE